MPREWHPGSPSTAASLGSEECHSDHCLGWSAHSQALRKGNLRRQNHKPKKKEKVLSNQFLHMNFAPAAIVFSWFNHAQGGETWHVAGEVLKFDDWGRGRTQDLENSSHQNGGKASHELLGVSYGPFHPKLSNRLLHVQNLGSAQKHQPVPVNFVAVQNRW